MTRVLLTLARPGPVQPRRRALYLAALQRAGAEVHPVFPGEPPPEEFDALCLSGGGDLDPRRYGQPMAGSDPPDAERDELELALLRRALERRAPVLGICRGLQVLNVGLGGTLRQHVDGHRLPEGAGLVQHRVDVAPGSLLERACGRGPLLVNSWHHQAVHPRDLARGVRATAVEGELVEALEAPHLGWVVGVQWHPERSEEVAEAATRIFDSFVAAAREPAERWAREARGVH